MRPSSGDVLEKEYRPRINRIIDYIHNHCGEDLSLTQLAGQACLSKFHFHRIFQAIVGETVSDFVRRFRLEHAARQLAMDSAVSIAQVAQTCGFSSPQNFARAFRAHFGDSPTSFRKNPRRQIMHPMQTPSAIFDGKTPFQAELKELPSYRVAYIRDIGPYYSEANARAFGRLFRWAVEEGLTKNAPIMPIAADWSDPETTPAEKCIFDACLTVPENVQGHGEVCIQYLPGGKFAVLHCEIELKDMPGAIKRLCHEWLPQNGYKRDDRPFFTIYYNNPNLNPRKLAILDMCLPIRSL